MKLSEEMRTEGYQTNDWRRVAQLEATNDTLLEALAELQKGIYDFTELPVYAKNFVYRVTNEAILKATEK